MEIHQLRIFFTVAQTKSFSKAAALLYVSQPMVTKVVKQLEEELGICLIERTSKSFHLTDAGERLYGMAAEMLSRFDDIGREISDLRAANAGSVTLAGPPLSLATFFPSLYKILRVRCPNVRYSLIECGSGPIVEMVLDGRADIGISQLPVVHPEIEVNPIVRDRCTLLVNENHPLAGQKSVSIACLAEEKFIALSKGFTMYDTVQDICRQAGFVPNIVFHTSLVSFAEKLVSLGEGIAILPRPLVGTYRPEGVCTVELEEFLPWEIGLVVSTRRYRSAATRRTLRIALDYFGDAAKEESYPPLSPL